MTRQDRFRETLKTLEADTYARIHHQCESCGKPATVYGGHAGAGSWAAYACDACAHALSYATWEKV